jgi:Arc/MetJ family transcription regulator
MRTTIAVDDKLMSEAVRLSRLKSPKAVVEEGLKLLIRIKKQDHIRKLKGKLKGERES